MPFALLPFRRLLSSAASRPMRALLALLAISGLGAAVTQFAMAAVTLDALTDGNDVVRTIFKPGDVIKASGSVDDSQHWKFVRVHTATGTASEVVAQCDTATSGTTPVSTTYTVQPTDAAGGWTFELRQFGSADSCTNDVSPDTASRAYTVDTTVPTVASIDLANASPTSAGSVAWTVTFSEDVTGVDATDFDLVPAGVTGASITDVSGTGSTWTVTASTGTGDGTLGLDLDDDDSIADAAGHPLAGTGTTGDEDGSVAGPEYTFDRTAPTVDAIDRADASPTNASSVAWTVTFSEDVTGVDAGDFSLAATGVTGADITDVSGSGATRTVTVDTGAGDGTLGLNLTDDDSITDAVGNALAAGRTGQTYTIDRTTPTATSINRADDSPTNAESVAWTVTFSEDVTGVDAGDFDLVPAGVSDALITGVTGTGSTWTVTASTGTGSGTLGLDLDDDDSIADALGNALAGPGTTGAHDGSLTGQVYAIDKTAPTAMSIDLADASPTSAGSVAWTVTFSEDVTGVGAGDFDLVPAGVSGASITGVTGSGSTWTVTASTGTGDGTLGLNLTDDDSITDTVGNALAGTGDHGRQPGRPGLHRRQRPVRDVDPPRGRVADKRGLGCVDGHVQRERHWRRRGRLRPRPGRGERRVDHRRDRQRLDVDGHRLHRHGRRHPRPEPRSTTTRSRTRPATPSRAVSPARRTRSTAPPPRSPTPGPRPRPRPRRSCRARR